MGGQFHVQFLNAWEKTENFRKINLTDKSRYFSNLRLANRTYMNLTANSAIYVMLSTTRKPRFWASKRFFSALKPFFLEDSRVFTLLHLIDFTRMKNRRWWVSTWNFNASIIVLYWKHISTHHCPLM